MKRPASLAATGVLALALAAGGAGGALVVAGGGGTAPPPPSVSLSRVADEASTETEAVTKTPTPSPEPTAGEAPAAAPEPAVEPAPPVSVAPATDESASDAAERARREADRAETEADRAEKAAAPAPSPEPAPAECAEGARKSDPLIRDGQKHTRLIYTCKGGRWIVTGSETYKLDDGSDEAQPVTPGAATSAKPIPSPEPTPAAADPVAAE